MSAPVRPPLQTELSTGASSNRPVNTIAFDNGDFTLTNSGTKTTVTLAAGSGSASLTDTYIGFGSASDLLTGSANFTFTEESGGNGPAVLLTGDKPVLKLQDDTAATDYRTEFLQSGASQYINSKDSGGTNNEMFRIDPTYIAMQRSMTPSVGIGTIPDSGVPLHVKGSTTGSFLLLENDDTGSSTAPDLVLYRNSTGPADNDFIGIIDFKGQDDGASEVYYGRIAGQIKDKSAGTHDGSMLFVPARGGSIDVNNNLLKLSGLTGATFNENGLDNFDFRVESDAYSKMFFIDAGLNKAHFGTGGIDNALGLVQINVGNSTQNALTLSSTDVDAAQAPTIEFYRNSTSPASDDKLGQLNFTGKDLNGDKVIYAQMYAQIDNPAIGSHDGRLVIDVVSNAASPINVFRADKDEVIINDVSFALDTRIESNGNENMFFIDGSSDTIGIAGIAQSDSTVTIYDTNDQDVLLRLETDENSADKSPALEFYKNSAADISDYIMAIDSYGLDDASNKSHYSRIATYIEDETAATENAVIIFQVTEAGSMRNNLVLGSTLITFNQSQRNVDLRVLADDGSENIRSDAGINAVGIQGQPTTGLADNNPALQVNGSVSSKCAIVTKTSATVDLSTRDSNELIGQLYVLTSTSAKTLTVPTTCTQGDWFRVLTTGANGMDIVASSGATLNGAVPATLTRDAQNEIYTVVAVATNKWICTSG